jgi:hypothetical protein
MIRANLHTAVGFQTKDIVSLARRARFSEPAEEIKRGSDNIITKNGESCVLVDMEKVER